MDLRRLRAGEWIAAAAGAVLLVSLFGPWYESERFDVNAWEAFSVFDVLLFVAGTIGVGVLVITASQRTAAVGIATQSLAFLVTAPIAAITLLRVLNTPGDLDAAGAGRATFAWVGLLAVLGVAVGCLVAMRDERISSAQNPTDPTGVPIEAQPEIETLPAPPRSVSS